MEPPAHESKRLNWRQACELLGCSKSQFYRLVKSGELRGFRIGGARRNLWVYEKDCLKMLVEAQARES